MSGLDLGGFDVVLKISEEELNDQLDQADAATFTVMVPLSQPVPAEITIDKVVILDHLDPFYNNKENPVALLLTALNGSVKIGVVGELRVDHVLNSPTERKLHISMEALTSADVDIIEIPASFQGQVTEIDLANAISDATQSPNEIYLHADPISVDPNPVHQTTLKEIGICTRGGTNPDPAKRSVNFLATMGTSVPVAPIYYPNQSLGGTTRTSMAFSNTYLLAKIIRPALESEFGANFNWPCNYSGFIPLDPTHQDFLWGAGTYTAYPAINQISVSVGNGYLNAYISGSITGDGIKSGTFDTTVRLYPHIVNGKLIFTDSVVSQNTDIRIKWWVKISLYLLFGLVGAVVALRANRIATKIADRLLSDVSGDLLDDVSGDFGMPSLPLGPVGTSLTLENVILDDLLIDAKITARPKTPTSGTGPKLDIWGSWVYDSSSVVSSEIDTHAMTVSNVIGHQYKGHFQARPTGFGYPIDIEWHARNSSNQYIHLTATSPGVWQSVNLGTRGKFSYTTDGTTLLIRNDIDKAMHTLLECRVSDSSGNRRTRRKACYAKPPTLHSCNFSGDILPNTTYGTEPGGRLVATQASFKAAAMVGLKAADSDIEFVPITEYSAKMKLPKGAV